jgi:hypothetical protein
VKRLCIHCIMVAAIGMRAPIAGATQPLSVTAVGNVSLPGPVNGFVDIGDRLLFSASTGTSSANSFYSFDGSNFSAVTNLPGVVLPEIYTSPARGIGIPYTGYAVGNNYLFAASGPDGNRLYKVVGNEIQKVSDIPLVTSSFAPLTPSGNQIYFVGQVAGDQELFRTDGNDVFGYQPDPGRDYSSVRQISIHGGYVLFRAKDTSTGFDATFRAKGEQVEFLQLGTSAISSRLQLNDEMYWVSANHAY